MKPWSTRAIVLAAAGLVCAPAATAADTFPIRPVRVIVNTAPGGFTDLLSRLAAQHMADDLGQPMVVDNRAGGDGMIAIRTVKSASADGYTLLAATATAAQQMALRRDPGYDLLKDFSGIGIITRSPYLVVVASSKPDKTLTEFIARAKANPDKMSYASAGVGTVSHFAAALFLQQAGLKLLHVPYKGNAPALPDVMSGRVDTIFTTYASGRGPLKAGLFRALAVTSPQRLAVLPDVATVAEQGVPGYSYYTWVGFFAPAGTPRNAIQRHAQALHHALSNDAVKARFRTDGLEAVDMSPEKFNQFLAHEVAPDHKLVSALGLEKR
ncbi:MAG: tripartite tricarboxylate transporter substrate binding protein [Burkholderiales bacterium]|nr:tripartite tricarboxylate transporter substrate binding protein [Burkholderiales bacterium]